MNPAQPADTPPKPAGFVPLARAHGRALPARLCFCPTRVPRYRQATLDGLLTRPALFLHSLPLKGRLGPNRDPTEPPARAAVRYRGARIPACRVAIPGDIDPVLPFDRVGRRDKVFCASGHARPKAGPRPLFLPRGEAKCACLAVRWREMPPRGRPQAPVVIAAGPLSAAMEAM